MSSCDATVLGAGPYGLSVGAHLGAIEGFDLRIVGEPMEFWRSHMPAGMSLRSPSIASSLSDPLQAHRYHDFAAQRGEAVPGSIPLARFVEYGDWFQQKVLPRLERKRAARVERDAAGFRIVLESGESWTSRRVVIAGGIGGFAVRPEVFARLPSELVAHCADVPSPALYGGKSVLVVGGGQSALETAALVFEAGAQVEVVMRADGICWLGRRTHGLRQLGAVGEALLGPAKALARLLNSPLGVGPTGVSRVVALPHSLRCMPRFVQDDLRKRSLRASAASGLRERLGGITITFSRKVVAAGAVGQSVDVKLCDGTKRVVDRVILGTGYKVDVSRYPFLAPALLAELETANGFPKLGRGLESTSIPGLHFAGAAAGWSYGPLMYFVAGTEFAAREIARRVRQRDGPGARR